MGIKKKKLHSVGWHSCAVWRHILPWPNTAQKDGKIRILQVGKKMSLYEVNETIGKSQSKTRTWQRSLTAHHSVVLTFPLVNLCLGLAAGPLGLPVAAVVLKAAPARDRNGSALIHSVVIYGRVIWVVFISVALKAVE